jgi:Helicase HerA, central domain
VTTLLRTAPPPALRVDGDVAAVPSAIFGIRIESAVNLLEAREYHGLDRDQRLGKALDEQRAFVNQLLDPRLGLVDLRTRVEPGAAVPIAITLLGRTWDTEATGHEDAAIGRRERLLASIPRHLSASPIEDTDELRAWVAPFGSDRATESVMITRRETTAIPRRADARVAYYFSVVPFNWADTDWTNLYSTISASRVPLMLSVALLPVALPDEYNLLLTHYATFYTRLAKEDRMPGGLYQGDRMIPPDAFAVDAQPVFEDYARRYAGQAFAIRIQVTAAGPIPSGMAEAIGAAISPGDVTRTHLSGNRASSSYSIRRAQTAYEQDLCRWNLSALDIGLLDGRPEIWERPDPPPLPLAALCALGDARDAACAFRFPIAVDGTVPGFKVRRGQFGHVEQLQTTGPIITLGSFSGGHGAVTLPVNSLNKHALIAGSTGSGKTTTVLEILRQLWVDHHIPFLVIEPVNSDANDYRRLLGEPGFEDAQIWTVGDENVRPLRFNPFRVPPGVLVGEHLSNLLNCFKAAFGLWEPLPGIYEEALSLTYATAGILPSERADDARDRFWPTAVEFMKAMRRTTAELGYAGEVKANIEAASVRRAQQLTVGVCASAFMTDQSFDIEALMDRPTILELKALGAGDEQSLMIALLLNAMTENYQAVRGASATLRHVTVVEEAHRLLARGSKSGGPEQAQAKEKAAEAFANTLAETRKYGEGLIIAEQIPSKLVEDAAKNTNLKVMHRLTAEEERHYLGETMGFDAAQSRFATRLSTGEALVYADEYPEATLAEIKPRLTASTSQPVSADVQPPFSFCAPCQRQCQFRGAGLAISRDGVLRTKIDARLAALAQPGLAPGDVKSGYDGLTSDLRSAVAAFSSLPSEEPERSHAALCVFVHVMAAQTMKMSPNWPKVVAERLGILERAVV